MALKVAQLGNAQRGIPEDDLFSATQIHLDLSKTENRKKAGVHLARRMIAYLAVTKCWTNRTEFKNAIGLTDRECRLGRVAAHGRILNGQKGYKLLKYATPEEISEAAGAWIKRIKANQNEYSQLMRRAHGVLNGREKVK